MEKAGKAGLSVDLEQSKNLVPGYVFQPNYKGELRNSLKWFYARKPREIMKPRYNQKGHLMTTRESLHESAQQRFHDSTCNYRPANLVLHLDKK